MQALIENVTIHVVRRGLWLAGAVLALQLAACAAPEELGEQAVNLNLGAEQAHNRILLLNVLRAYRRRPMHFMRLSALRGAPPLGGGTLGASVPLGGAAQNLYNLTTSANISRATLDAQLLDSQEFMQGITRPVAPELLVYFLEQGWPQQLVLHLFVRTIEVRRNAGRGDEVVERYVNYPENEATMLAFQRELSSFAKCRFSTRADDRKPFGPVYTADEVKQHLNLIDLHKAELQLVETDAQGVRLGVAVNAHGTSSRRSGNARHYRLTKPGDVKRLIFSNAGPDRVCPHRANEIEVSSPTSLPSSDTQSGKRPPDGETISTVFYLRSPEAMVYYLGEVSRAQLDGRRASDGRLVARGDAARVFIDFSPDHHSDDANIGERVSLFTISRDGALPGAAVITEYDGQTYSVPDSSANDRSMHALSLISQVLMLQDKGDAPPATSTVRIVP